MKCKSTSCRFIKKHLTIDACVWRYHLIFWNNIQKRPFLKTIFVWQFLHFFYLLLCHDIDEAWFVNYIVNSIIKLLKILLYFVFILKGCLQLPVQSMSFHTKVVIWHPAHGEMYLIQHYVIKFVSDLWQVGGFLWVFRCPSSIKLNVMI